MLLSDEQTSRGMYLCLGHAETTSDRTRSFVVAVTNRADDGERLTFVDLGENRNTLLLLRTKNHIHRSRYGHVIRRRAALRNRS